MKQLPKLFIEALGETHGDALKHALTVIGMMIQDLEIKAKWSSTSSGSTTGSATGEWEAVDDN